MCVVTFHSVMSNYVKDRKEVSCTTTQLWWFFFFLIVPFVICHSCFPLLCTCPSLSWAKEVQVIELQLLLRRVLFYLANRPCTHLRSTWGTDSWKLEKSAFWVLVNCRVLKLISLMKWLPPKSWKMEPESPLLPALSNGLRGQLFRTFQPVPKLAYCCMMFCTAKWL